MKEISQNDIELVKAELSAKRKEFEKLGLTSLEERLKWIRDFFNTYVPELEQRYMTKEEFFNEWVFLPDELRIQFYLYFPEHGLNMANYSYELAIERKHRGIDRFYLSHND